ncbi:DEAD/DEAH box helicase, putative [Plasmodium knowlesi strain H]|uniref:DEAD/DEAH box helicase, putative n=3 Tax=Plasmodium knowlesi TaxID=5850 RepID=A0A5K1TWM0_PLAKH|nr:ATP-dependent RNA helicase DDX60, putative [Plasmodium knowlesi strain H]OTN67246.1 putative DEAD/DEAH box helicase [Plasmodium knowlesi]CAA9987301.1 ATP-dependent RNA helicase DDX60, putative [Plasmodium knowlesi strain H]SBO23424.1 DEAD/DEAH box helicase, putative [Plasmodium knowlesi strain H]SBO24705.1 DEAD/DEAH box helicase, putative [Plasmodium knowlesi strain H]VVS76775.1 ATP-dependent RNA helicase DDX60, putative [Plasmodium knowlesi strain H]|eukprot:XP_002258305.1 dead/deah box helicase, putative [Plasmodium knowlesi strain H]
MNLTNDEYRINKLNDMKDLRIAEYDGRRRYAFFKECTENDLNDVENVVNNKSISVDTKIEIFYSKLHSKIFDIFRIVADYNCLYIINGEGLIIHICMLLSKFYSFENEEDKNILSFNNSLNISSAIYYVEKILSDLSVCNSNFHILFFNIFNIFFEKETQIFRNYNLVRNAFIIHCKKNLIPFFIFDNWYNDNNYNLYLIKYKPLFMFVEDSSSFLYAFNKFYVSPIEDEAKANMPYEGIQKHDGEENAGKDTNYKEYILKKRIYDHYNEEIRELSICLYFLLINNISRDIKCVFFFNFESEKNTINAFSINYMGINFKVLEMLNKEASILFDRKFYGKEASEGRKYGDSKSSGMTKLLITSHDIKDYDLLHKEEEKYSKEEQEILESFSKRVIKDGSNLKNVVLGLFYESSKAMKGINEQKKWDHFLFSLKLLFMHNYLIEKLNMKNLCVYDQWKGDSENIAKAVKGGVEPYVCLYLDIYNFVLKTLQKETHCDTLKNAKNIDLLNFFNASIVHNLINFVCFKLRKNLYVIDHEDFSFEEKNIFEGAFQNVVGDDGITFFPLSFSFLKDDMNFLQKREVDDLANQSEETSNSDRNAEQKNEGELVTTIDNGQNEITGRNKKNTSNGNVPTNVNLIKIRNDFIETFFSVDDLVKNGKMGEDTKSVKIKLNLVNKCVEYDSEFFELSGLLHISDRESLMDILKSYFKISRDNRVPLNMKDKDDKYKLRRQQRDEKRKAIIAKYLNISSLHHPIVISENHPWIKYYVYTIEKLYNYLKDEEKKNGIKIRMKRLFDGSSDGEVNQLEGQSKGSMKKTKKIKNDIFEMLDDSNEDSNLENDMKQERRNNREENKKGRNEKGAKKGGKANVNTLSRKDEILKKKEMSSEKKIYEVDLERYNVLEAKVNKLRSNNSYSDMNTWSLDIISGFNRLVDVYNFNNVTNLIKSVELQIKISIKVLTSMFEIIMYTKLKNVKSTRQKSDAIRSVMLIYKLTNEIFNKFKENLSEKDIVQLQVVLLSLGFKHSSYNLFEEYVKVRRNLLKLSGEGGEEEADEDKVGSAKIGKGNEKIKVKDGATLNDKKKGVKQSGNQGKSKGGKKANEIGGENDGKGSKQDKRKEGGKDAHDIYKYKVESVQNYSELKIDEKKEHEFQLYYMYYLLDRTTGNIKDKRVLFTLDTWQYNILNLVDRRKSILVSCPTSSGKTFICYYVMDKVLRLNNDSVVVYVAPNDTLAFQIYHEVNGRFSTKGYSKYGGNKLCSYMTDKYAEENALDAQIVIVLPSVFENILLSGYAVNDENSNLNVSKFISRIEYIIFDEIHCIGDKEFYGSQIENIIHLCNAPFLALSATIGNIKYFYSWLQNVMMKKGKGEQDLHLIKFYERFSDLILYVYTNNNLHHLNPLACFNFRDILYKGINKDFYCNPREIYEIIIVLFELARKNNFYHLVEFLEPSFYFQYTRCINKKQFIYYMHTVKETIVYLIQNKYISNLDYDMFIHILLSNYMKNTDCVKEEEGEKDKVVNEEVPKKELNDTSSSSTTKHLYRSTAKEVVPKQQLFQELYKTVVLDQKYIKNKSHDLVKYTETVNTEQEYLDSSKLIELLKQLEQINFLPCIVFNFERKELEDMTINLINELMRRQHDKYYGDEERTFNTKMENKMRQERYENLLKQREILLKMKTVSRNQRLEQNMDKEYLDMLNEEEIPEPPVDVSEEYDGDFYFCNRKVYINYVTEIEDLIKEAERAIEGRKYKSVLIEGMKRGIGLHYEVLPYKFTIIVESLFRLGYIKIIFSNKNLSLGINIPCKSIIFAGHTFELNSVMFKQTSGRAGRRGFDLYGNIIIWNINFKNLSRLITSPLQTLSGSYAVNFTNICRSMLLYNCLKKNKDMEEFNNRNKAVVNKPIKKKKKDETMTVAEKEEIFDKNRIINVNFFTRINGILSVFYNSLYYVNAFQHWADGEGDDKMRSHFSERVTMTNGGEVHQEKLQNGDIEVNEKNPAVETTELLNYHPSEFDHQKEKSNALKKYVDRKYEYNELCCDFLAMKEGKRRDVKEGEKHLKELCFRIKAHFLMFINILVEMEAIDEECNIINMTELAIFLKKECDNNLILTYLLVKRVLHNIVGDGTFLGSPVGMIPLQKIIDRVTFEKNYSRNVLVDDSARGQFILLFILSHFINKIKENKIALTKVLINFHCKVRTKLELFSSTYFPLLHILPAPVRKHIKNIEGVLLRYLMNYSLLVLAKLNLLQRKKTYLLPYTQLYIFEQHPSLHLGEIFPEDNSEYLSFYQSKLQDYKVRSPFLASLYHCDNFESLDELLYTSILDLDIRKNMIPDIGEDYISFFKFEDGVIKEEKVCLKNSYILDYFIHGKYNVLRSKNDLGQYSWYIVDRFIQALNNIEHFLHGVKKDSLLLSSDVFYTYLNNLKDVLEKYFKSINSAQAQND